MSGIKYYRDPDLGIFEIKSCYSGVHASRRHVHEEFSLGAVMNGSSLVSSTGQDFSVGQGSLIMIPPGTVHQCQPKDIRDWQFQMLYLKADWVASLLATKPADLAISVKKLNDRDFRRVLSLFQILGGSFTALEKETCLITELQYFFNFEGYFRQKPDPRVINPQAMRRVREYLQKNYLEKIDLDDLAEIAGRNKYHLLHCFKAAYKTTPHAYQTMLRINYAKELLRKKQREPITAIAQDAGFFDQSHFVKSFRQYSGTTPLDYSLGQ